MTIKGNNHTLSAKPARIEKVIIAAAVAFLSLPSAGARAGERHLSDATVDAAGSVSTWQGYVKSGYEAMDLGNYAMAEKIFNEGLRSQGKDADAEAAMRTGLGETYLMQGDFADSGKQLNKAYSLLGKRSGKEKDRERDKRLAEVLDALAWVNQGLGKLDKAQDLCQQALDLAKAVLPPDSSDLGDTYEHLGQLLEKKGLLAQAEGLYKEALKIRIATTGPKSMMTANIIEKLGAITERRGMTDDAAQYFQHALQLKEASQAIFQPSAPHRAEDTCVFRYLPGAANCGQGYSESVLSQSITANNVTVQASILRKPSDFAKFNHARVVIKNNSDATISILATPAKFIVLEPKISILEPLDSNALAQRIEKKGDSKAKWIRFWGNQATTTSTTTVMGNYPTYGYMPFAFGYTPITNRNGGMTTMTTSVPDYQKRAMAMVKAQQTQDRSAADASQIRDNALGPMSIAPHSQIEGSLNFPEVDFSKVALRIPVGNASFEFLFDRAGQ